MVGTTLSVRFEMMQRTALTTFTLAMLAIAAAYASAFLPSGAPVWASWTFAFAMPAAFVALMALGAAKRGRLGRLAPALALVFVLLAGGFAVVLLLPAEDPADPVLWLGLPRRAAVLLYGVGLLPLVLVPVAYALTFDTLTLGPDDVERVRAAAERHATADRRSSERDEPAAAEASRTP